jgi:hypothetical protein
MQALELFPRNISIKVRSHLADSELHHATEMKNKKGFSERES